MRNKKEPTSADPLVRSIFIEADNRGLQVQELAEMAGLDYHAVAKMRRPNGAQRSIRLETLQKLAAALKLEIRLVGASDENMGKD